MGKSKKKKLTQVQGVEFVRVCECATSCLSKSGEII